MPSPDQDLFRQPVPRLSNTEVEEKAHDAQAILDSKVVQDALNDIYSRHLGTLVEAEVGSLTASAAHASIRAITDLKKQLEQYVADHKVRQKYHKESKKEN